MTRLLDDDVLVSGHRIAAGVHGEGEPVVLVHGTPAHSELWRRVIPPLVEGSCRVHVFDLLGFGRSERPADPSVNTSVAGQDGVLTELLRYWGLDSAHVVAHDIGGAIGMRFALFHPEMVRTLTVIDTPSYDSWPSRTWREIIARGLETLMRAPGDEHRERFGRQLRMAVHDKSVMDGELLDLYLDAISGPVGQPSFFQHQVAHYDSRYTEEIAPRLGELGEIPTQILWGEADEWQPVDYGRRLAADIPGAELHVIPDAGHFCMEDDPDTVARLALSHVLAARR
jgi:pimeloyl-ACP methyl ester carboxylesterase